MSIAGKETIWTPKFIMVILFTFLSYAAAFLTYPLVAKFSLSLNPDLTLASTIAGLMSLASLFVCPFAGVLSDRFSRKRILQISSVFYGAVLIMHAFIRSIPALIVLRLLVGVFFSVNNHRHRENIDSHFLPFPHGNAAVCICNHRCLYHLPLLLSSTGPEPGQSVPDKSRCCRRKPADTALPAAFR